MLSIKTAFACAASGKKRFIVYALLIFIVAPRGETDRGPATRP